MSKYTPGPWFVRKWDGDEWPDRRISIGPQSNGTAIAVCISPRYYDDEQMEADAKLIAAAPELLDALESALTILIDSVGDFDYDKARAAIAKATGGN